MLQRYRETDLATATPEMLVVRLYDGAMRFAHQARAHVDAGRAPERARALSRALAIVSELQAVLDHERGGEIARNLHALYDFVTDRLVAANLEERGEPIDQAVGILETLAEGWREIAANPPSRGAAP